MSLSDDCVFSAGQAGAIAGAIGVARAALLELAKNGGAARLNELEASWLPTAEASAVGGATPEEVAVARRAHAEAVKAIFAQVRADLG